jgi:hypothetical protein
VSRLSRVLRAVQEGGLAFWCPGCNGMHVIYQGEGRGARWSWNGNAERPTFTPSVLIRSGHFASHFKAGVDSCWCTYNAEHPEDADFKCRICHSFVTDGQIRFLNDCTHELAGKTVPLPDLPGEAS